MKRVVLVHRWSGGPNDDWRPWLRSELEGQDLKVLVPEMPDSDRPVIEKWVAKLSEVVGVPDSDTYFIGHSIGCQTILRYLENLNVPVGGAVFVAGWFNLENLEDEDTASIARPWLENAIDLIKVRSILPKSALLISDNDPYGSFQLNQEKFRELGSEVLVVPGGGHFTAEDGFQQLPQILDIFARVLQ